jgi:hypothetical protein
VADEVKKQTVDAAKDIAGSISGNPISQTKLTVKIGCLLGMLLLIICLIFFAISIGGAEKKTDESNDAYIGVSCSGIDDTTQELGVVKMPYPSGKIGHEEHAAKSKCFLSGHKHFSAFMTVGSVTNCMAFGGNFKTDQERYYFNMRWEYSGSTKEQYRHKKVIITNPKNGKRIVTSIEEYGPAAYLKSRDGIVAGAPPDVYKYLELANPYTKKPGDKKGAACFGLAKDQSIPLGPLN